jgi:hypothetical protein
VHPTALGATNRLAAPDWPGVTATSVEQALGGTALIFSGALGHTWPALPPGTPPSNDDTQRLQRYGALMTARALAAVSVAQPVHQPTICVADRHFREADLSAPLLLGLQAFGRDGHERILRATTAPYYVPPNALGVEVETVRIGDLAFFAAPVEAYPSLLFALRQHIYAETTFFLGLANDQLANDHLGYAIQRGEYLGALRESPSDEALFILNPDFGDQLVSQLTSGARQVGLPVS